MSYEKHTWETGETITAEKLNHIEDGVAESEGGVVLITGTSDGSEEGVVLNASYNDLLSFVNNGVIPIIKISNENSDSTLVFLAPVSLLVYDATASSGNYKVQLINGTQFIADDPNSNMVKGDDR